MRALRVQNSEEAVQLLKKALALIDLSQDESPLSGLGTNLSARKGDVAFNIALHGDFPVDQIKAKEKTLALQILSKL